MSKKPLLQPRDKQGRYAKTAAPPPSSLATPPPSSRPRQPSTPVQIQTTSTSPSTPTDIPGSFPSSLAPSPSHSSLASLQSVPSVSDPENLTPIDEQPDLFPTRLRSQPSTSFPPPSPPPPPSLPPRRRPHCYPPPQPRLL